MLAWASLPFSYSTGRVLVCSDENPRKMLEVVEDVVPLCVSLADFQGLCYWTLTILPYNISGDRKPLLIDLSSQEH
jgi:hypothetical protein